MQKIGFGIIGLVVVAGLYYFTSGSTQITQEIKKQVNHELTTLQQNGFTVEDREIKESEEHFVLSFSEPVKIASYLKTQGIQVKAQDFSSIKGMKFAIDAKYLDDAYSALSVDIYPKKLPEKMVAELKAEEKQLLVRIEKMLADKTLLIHIDFNKLLSGFKGYVKDIDETFKDEVTMNFTAKGMKFEGDLEKEKLKSLQQNIKNISLIADKEVNITLSNINVNYTLTGSSIYDTESSYKVEQFKIYASDAFNVNISNIEGSSTTGLHSKLLKSAVKNTIDKITFNEKQKKYELNKIDFNAEVNNLDIDAFEQLQTVDPEDHTAINTLIQQVLSRGVSFNISKFSSKEVKVDDRSTGNFNITASGELNKTFDLTGLKENPLALLGGLSTKTYIEASPELFSLLVQDPRAMMVLMLFPPKEKNGQKVYDIQYIKGKLTVNGTSMF